MVDDNIQRRLNCFKTRPYRTNRLGDYLSRNSKDNLTVLHDDNVADALREQGYSIEESPRSIYKVDKLYEALSAYAPGTIPKLADSAELRQGISLAYACFARPREKSQLTVMPFTPDTIVKITRKPSASAGLTSYGHTKAEAMTRALERGLQTLKGVKAPEPCLGFKRTQFNDKTRLVWGYPYSMTAIEGLVAKPLLDEFKKGCTPMAFAMSSMALGTKLCVASYRKNWAYSLDMSQYDATLSSGLISIAFKVLKTWFDLHEIEPISGKTVGEIFDVIERYFIHTTIVMPDGKLYIGKDHGVPSGSYFTQIIDSVCNVIIAGTLSARFKLNVAKEHVFVLGDDLLIWSDRRVSLDALSRYAAEALSVKLHGSEKSEIFAFDEAVHYLGRDWENGLPTLETEEITKRMVYPETYRKYTEDDEQEKDREIRMLILSYAAVYYQGWSIASDLLDGSGRNYAKGCSNLDRNTYRACLKKGVDPTFLSGLERFRRQYLIGTSSESTMPITATQYWL